MARKGEYLYQRKGSPFWYLRLQYPTAELREAARTLLGREVPAKVERSLGTADRRHAEVVAGPEILEHKRLLLMHRATMNPMSIQSLTKDERAFVDRAMMQPVRTKFQLHPLLLHPQGSTIRENGKVVALATKDELIHLDSHGNQTGTSPNFKGVTFTAPIEEIPIAKIVDREREWRSPTVKADDLDTEIVENWIKRREPASTHVNAGRKMLALFKQLHPTKTFASAEREDALAMVEHMKAEGNLSATIKGKMSTLVAAVNLELENKKPRLRYNAFAGTATKGDDATLRLPLSEADVKKINARRDLFTTEQWLMWQFCQNTGMRPKEVYALREEFVDVLDHHPVTGEFTSIRYVWINRSKTTSSTRKLPIPSAVLPLLPEGGIRGKLFTEKLDELCRLINVAMQSAGVTSPDPETGKERLVFYSTRHRVKDRLLNAGCSEDIRKSMMGHSKKAAHDGYGQGFAMWILQPWIEYLNPDNTRPPAPPSEMMLRQLIEDQRKEIEKIKAA